MNIIQAATAFVNTTQLGKQVSIIWTEFLGDQGSQELYLRLGKILDSVHCLYWAYMFIKHVSSLCWPN